MTSIHMNIDRSTKHEVVLRFTDFDIGTHGETVFEHKIKPEDIPNFLRDITNTALIALTEVGQTMAYGDCKTCKNFRLVEAPTYPGADRTWRVSCPDCATERPVPFRSYPVYGGGLSDDQKEDS